MRQIAKKDKRTNLEVEIDLVIEKMRNVEPNTDEYTTMASNLERLYKLKAIDAGKKISPDTMALIVGNIAGLILIMSFEKTNVITTKALGFVLRGRV